MAVENIIGAFNSIALTIEQAEAEATVIIDNLVGK